MVKTLEQAIAQISRLPEADQEQIGRKLLSHVEKLNALRAEIDKGIHSLDENQGSALNLEDFLRRKNSGHGGA
jgi:transposase